MQYALAAEYFAWITIYLHVDSPQKPLNITNQALGKTDPPRSAITRRDERHRGALTFNI